MGWSVQQLWRFLMFRQDGEDLAFAVAGLMDRCYRWQNINKEAD